MRKAGCTIHYTIQSGAEKRNCFAKHQPSWRGRLWLAAAGQKLSLNLAPFLLLNPVHYKPYLAFSFFPCSMSQYGVSGSMSMATEANSGTADSTMDAVLHSRKWPVTYARTNPAVSEMVCTGGARSQYMYNITWNALYLAVNNNLIHTG